MCVGPSLHPTLSLHPRLAPLLLSVLLDPFPTAICSLLYSSSLFFPSEENSFVALDHSGILTTEFVSLLEETEFTILIDAYPAPKVLWLKDGKAISESYYVLTKTSHVEGNR